MNIKFASSTPLWNVPDSTPPAPQPTPPAPAADTTTPSTTTDWSPYVIDAAKSTQENLAAKAEHDKTAPAGHDPNTPYKAPAPAADPAKPAAPDPNAPPAPAAPVIQFTDLKAPEGFTLDEGLTTEMVQLLTTKSGDPKALAQGLVDLQVKASKLAQETDSKQWDDVQVAWQKATEKDPEIGGAKYSETKSTMESLATRFGGPAFQEALTLTGMGNHPEFARFMSKIAPFLKEAAPVVPPAPSAPATRFSPTNLYPEQGKK